MGRQGVLAVSRKTELGMELALFVFQSFVSSGVDEKGLSENSLNIS